MKSKVQIVWNKFPLIARQIGQAASTYDLETLEWGRELILAGMWESTPGPSLPGKDPAIVSGELMDSLTVEMEDEQKGYLYTDLEYAPYLEYGTTNMAPRPFMTPASERMRKRQIGLFKEIEKDLG